MKQIEFKLPTWGGERKGAGRKPNSAKPGVSHLRRPSFAARYPVHVTMRMVPAVGFLRAYSRVQAIEQAMREVRQRFGLRVVHYSIQGNHLHLIVEIDDAAMLSRAINGLAVRLARALNRLAGRNGKVFLDRYHAKTSLLRARIHAHRRHGWTDRSTMMCRLPRQRRGCFATQWFRAAGTRMQPGQGPRSSSTS